MATVRPSSSSKGGDHERMRVASRASAGPMVSEEVGSASAADGAFSAHSWKDQPFIPGVEELLFQTTRASLYAAPACHTSHLSGATPTTLAKRPAPVQLLMKGNPGRLELVPSSPRQLFGKTNDAGANTSSTTCDGAGGMRTVPSTPSTMSTVVIAPTLTEFRDATEDVLKPGFGVKLSHVMRLEFVTTPLISSTVSMIQRLTCWISAGSESSGFRTATWKCSSSPASESSSTRTCSESTSAPGALGTCSCCNGTPRSRRRSLAAGRRTKWRERPTKVSGNRAKAGGATTRTVLPANSGTATVNLNDSMLSSPAAKLLTKSPS
mmetsp:Transcript_121294/g.354558  ORF Transcript_121294/g.354558 Transcript_121294/m.354558 type:complete len:323 (-) Transcript_121294:2116-3084(-)